jgi:hypothetical protein
VLLTWLLPFLATEGSRVLEKKANDTQVSKTVFSHLKIAEVALALPVSNEHVPTFMAPAPPGDELNFQKR